MAPIVANLPLFLFTRFTISVTSTPSSLSVQIWALAQTSNRENFVMMRTDGKGNAQWQQKLEPKWLRMAITPV